MEMKTKIMWLYYLFFIIACSFHVIGATTSLNWVEVADNKLSTQIMLDFSGPVKFKTNIDENKHQLDLIFDGMDEQHFKSQHVYNKLETLKSQGIIKTIDIESNDNSHKLKLSIQFAPHDQQNRENKLIVKSSSVAHNANNKIIIDIYTKQKLDQVANKNKILLLASNTRAPLRRPRMRIMIDPGHGGSQLGARGFGLEEKKVALDISRRVYKRLKKAGHNVLLTRSSDEELSLLERSKLAHQLKADLLVSIHANSSGILDSPASGIETYHAAEVQNTKLLCINMDNDHEIKKITDHTNDYYVQSKKLASTIQTSILSSIEEKKIEVRNRGVKSQYFRLFLQNPIPTALVEVGFITNKQEASLLKQASYRQLLANGICNGILAHLQKS